MAEMRDPSQLFYSEVKAFSQNIRHLICEQHPTPSLLADLVQALVRFKELAAATEMVSFCLITERLETVIGRHAAAATQPTAIEIETIELAVDWLDQLAFLHQEDFPEPGSLVTELLYTFDLVERSHDAVSLAELVASDTEARANKPTDPFSEDPEVNVRDCAVVAYRDPFAEDPGFGLEFDLLQRTVHYLVETESLGDDPFSADPAIASCEGDVKTTQLEPAVLSKQPYDLFASDPPLGD
ncbi:hypothetical protein SAMN05660420_01301 [Desulfuromusa kysingii]|uniref:Uncharacterized protein n=1 Tax=Desulfuromusa kysingii TaxID=37625 RepID=A0A1H3YMG0_9BACT|nr:hypothetical protein [Desulfuromusa kysingii]SEA12730.1 hypothetical protein SAMN05660420_01301 [Desulfuromusa kysingii]